MTPAVAFIMSTIEREGLSLPVPGGSSRAARESGPVRREIEARAKEHGLTLTAEDFEIAAQHFEERGQ